MYKIFSARKSACSLTIYGFFYQKATLRWGLNWSDYTVKILIETGVELIDEGSCNTNLQIWVKWNYQPLPNGGIFHCLDFVFNRAAENLKTSLFSPAFSRLESTTKLAPFLNVITFCKKPEFVSMTCKDKVVRILRNGHYRWVNFGSIECMWQCTLNAY